MVNSIEEYSSNFELIKLIFVHYTRLITVFFKPKVKIATEKQIMN